MKKTGKRLFSFFFLSFIFSLSCMYKLLSFWPLSLANQGKSIQVLATVDKNKFPLGENLTLTVSVSASKEVQIQEPRLPSFSDFNLLNAWQSMEMKTQIIQNSFQQTSTKKFSYLLQPNKEGLLTIKPIKVLVDGSSYQTKAIQIQVTPSDDQKSLPPSLPQQAPRGFFGNQRKSLEDLLSNFFGDQKEKGSPEDHFFVHVNVDKTEVFKGEQVLVSWFIYTRADIRDVDTLKHPNLTGFWKENVDIAKELKAIKEVVNGIVYNKIFLATYALFPIKSGLATIDPYTIRALLFLPSSFGFGGFRRSHHIKKSSESVEIKVLPLPKEGQPKNFTQAVGEFKVKAKLDNSITSVNQPFNLKIFFEGKGNAKLIELPSPIEFPSSLEHYDTKKESRYSKNGRSFKEFELVLIPRKEGEIKIPSFQFHAFNPRTKNYYLLSTPEMDLKVLPAKETPLIPSRSLKDSLQKDIKEKNQQDLKLPPPLLNWKDLSFLSSFSHKLKQNLWIWFLAFSFVFLLFLSWFFSLLRQGSKKNFKKAFLHRIHKIKKQVSKEDWRSVGVEGTNTIYFILGKVSGEQGAHLKVEELLMRASPSFRHQVEKPLKDILKKFEILSFAPEELVSSLKEKKELKKLVLKMEKILSLTLQEDFKNKYSDSIPNSKENKNSFFLSLLVLFFFLSFLKSENLKAQVHSVKISIEKPLFAPRWMYEAKDEKKLQEIKKSDKKTWRLYKIKKNQKEKQYEDCIKNIKKIKNPGILKNWLALTGLNCAKEKVLAEKKKAKNLKSSLEKLEKSLLIVKKIRFSSKSKPSSLNSDYIEAALVFLKRKRGDNDLFLSSSLIRDLESLKSEMSSHQRATFFLEMAFILISQKDEFTAKDFLLRSLNERDSEEAKKALNKVLKELRRKKNKFSFEERKSLEDFLSSLEKDRKPAKDSSISIQKQKGNFEKLKNEERLFKQMNTAFSNKKWLRATRKALSLIRFHSGGKKADQASKIVLRIYFHFLYALRKEEDSQVKSKKYNKNKVLKNKIVKQMERAGGDRISHWAYRIYTKHFYKEALFLGKKAFQKLNQKTNTTSVLRTLAFSALYLGKFYEAEMYFKQLSFEHSGTQEGDEALLQLGLLKFRLESYIQASDYLKLLIGSSYFQMEAYYWLWRSQQKLNSLEASKWAQKLANEYPMTYYGLRAKAELNQGSFQSLSHRNSPNQMHTSMQMFLTQGERESWSKFKILLGAGWFKEAQEELHLLSLVPKSPQEKIVWSKLWSLSFEHQKASSLLREALQEDKSLFNLSSLKWAYPKDFQSSILRESQRQKVNPLLVRSLIKQESEYKIKAKSSKNALGLMQILPTTAREQAQLMRKKLPSTNKALYEALFDPDLNVSLGVGYLKRMIRAFNGHIPLALAAYNAGIGNIRMWRKEREDLRNLEKNLNSHFEHEVWFDELPWSETRFYVKAVLRNFLIYLMLFRGEMKWSPVFWLKKEKRKNEKNENPIESNLKKKPPSPRNFHRKLVSTF